MLIMTCDQCTLRRDLADGKFAELELENSSKKT